MSKKRPIFIVNNILIFIFSYVFSFIFLKKNLEFLCDIREEKDKYIPKAKESRKHFLKFKHFNPYY